MPDKFPLDKDGNDYTFIDYFEQYGPITWTVGGKTLGFPLLEITEDGGNRISEDERAYRDGAHLQDTGSRAKRFNFRAIFDNGLTIGPEAELVLNDLNGGVQLYPDVLNAVLDSFDTHEVGDLYVPTRGLVRARAADYSRVESASVRNSALVTFAFIVDNEDSLDAASFANPSVGGSAATVAEVIESEAETLNAWDGSVAQLTELANNIEGMANAPGDFLNDVETQSKIVMNACDKVAKVHTDTTKEGRDLLLDPESTKLWKHLRAMKEMAGGAAWSARRGLPTYETRVYTRRLSIFDVAVIESADAAILTQINPQIPDLLEIEAGTPVRILVGV